MRGIVEGGRGRGRVKGGEGGEGEEEEAITHVKESIILVRIIKQLEAQKCKKTSNRKRKNKNCE
jgi:hypothetical protein